MYRTRYNKLGKIIEIGLNGRFDGYYDIEWYVHIDSENNYSNISHDYNGFGIHTTIT